MYLENSMTIILQLLILLSVLWPTLQKLNLGTQCIIQQFYLIVHRTLYTVQCTVYNVAMYTVHCVHVCMCRRMFICVHSTLHCTLYKCVVMCVGVLYAYFLVISLIFSPHLVSSNTRASHLCVYHVVCVQQVLPGTVIL